MMYLIMVTKIAKPAGAMIIWLLLQIKGPANTVFGRLLEYGALVAVLGLVAFIFYKAWKDSDGYNKERDERLENLIENNTKAMTNTKNAIDDMRQEQREFRNELKVLHRRTLKNREMISRWHENQ